MTQAVTNPNQKLPSPEGRAIGFVDNDQDFYAVIQALTEAGIPKDEIQIYHGRGSIELLEKNKGKFFLGDGEERMMEFAVRQLIEDRYAISIPVENRDHAMQLATMAQQLGGHSFGYFGTWVNERLTK